MSMSFPLPTGSLRMECCGDLLVFAYSGVASTAMVRESASRLVDIDPGRLAPVWRIDGAVWAEASAARGSMICTLPQFEQWPAAFVVQPQMMDWWRDYARKQAERGMVRAAFTDYEQAYQWAAARTRVAIAQARHEQQSRTPQAAQSAHTFAACDHRPGSRRASWLRQAQSD